MTQETFLQRVKEILHPHQGIPAGADAKAMIAEAYDIHITGLEREHAESRTEGLVDYLKGQEEAEKEAAAKAQYEIDHDL